MENENVKEDDKPKEEIVKEEVVVDETKPVEEKKEEVTEEKPKEESIEFDPSAFTETPKKVEDEVASVKEIFRLQGASELRAAELQYLPINEPARAIIINAAKIAIFTPVFISYETFLNPIY